MRHALLSFVVALGLIAGQDPLLQVRQQACWSASRGAIDATTNSPAAGSVRNTKRDKKTAAGKP